MEYDSANIQYTFESSAICEVNASNSNGMLYVNQLAKPEINLASNNSNTAHNLYFLDTVQRKWVYKGKDTVSDVGKLHMAIHKPVPVTITEDVAMQPPVKPVKAGNTQPVIAVNIEPGSVPELQVYNNLKFELDAAEKNFNPTDAETEWQDIKVDKQNTPGKYMITFTSTSKKVSYAVKPVFEEKDYDKAMKVFEEKNKEYERLVSARKKAGKENKEAYEKYKLNEQQIKNENERILKLNILVEARNKEIEKQNKIVEAENKKIEEQNIKNRLARLQAEARNKQISDSMKKEMEILQKKAEELQRREQELNVSYGNIIRTFSIEGFGVWNCDHPQLPYKEIPLAATFTDEKENNLTLINPVVVYKGFNGITRFYNQNIRVIPGTDNMIWAIADDKFVYITYQDYRKCSITTSTKAYTFRMRMSEQKVNSYDEIKKIIGEP